MQREREMGKNVTAVTNILTENECVFGRIGCVDGKKKREKQIVYSNQSEELEL